MIRYFSLLLLLPALALGETKVKDTMLDPSPGTPCRAAQASVRTAAGWKCITVSPTPGALVAFPGAEGAGAFSVGGRGGRIYKITHTGDSGPGSLRECVEATGPRICLPQVGGVYVQTRSFMVSSSYLTIAGQVAPGGGIAIRNKLGGTGEADAHIFSIRDGVHDIVLQYLNLWGQPCAGPGACSYGVAMKPGVHDVIVDHCSFEWFSGEAFNGGWTATSATRLYNITLQHSVLAEPLVNPQSTMIRVSNSTYDPAALHDLDMHHNLISSAASRMPTVASDSCRFVNNAIFNWSTFATDFEHGTTVDLIGNYFRPGSVTLGNGNMNCKTEFTFGPGQPPDPSRTPSVYMVGNKSDYSPACEGNSLNGLPTRSGAVSGTDADGSWSKMTVHTASYQGPIDQYPLDPSFRRPYPLATAGAPITIHKVDDLAALLSAAGGAGASRRLNCDGSWTNRRTTVDARIMSQFVAGTGFDSNAGYTTPEGWNGSTPTLPTDSTWCTDTDNDGMPDVWEIAQGLDPNVDDASDTEAGEVYSNIERYLAGR